MNADLNFAGGSSFTVAGVQLPRDRAIVGLDLKLALSETAAFSLSYNGQFAATGNSHAATAMFRVGF